MPRPSINKEGTNGSTPEIPPVEQKQIVPVVRAVKVPAILERANPPATKEDLSDEVQESMRKKWENIVYEATIDGKIRRYPTTTITPKKGKFFVMRTYESDGRSRILVSPKDWNESFPFSVGPVLTKYGLADGQTCNITLKLIDVMVDISSEEVIGVYLVVMTPSFAQINVDARKLIKTVTNYDVLRAKEEVMTHEALNLKYQLDEAMQRAETYRQALFERETNIVTLAEDFAAPIIETTLGALAATKDMFDQYYGNESTFWEQWKVYIIIMLLAIGSLGIYLLFGRGG